MTINPTKSTIAIQLLEQETKTQSGIVLPGQSSKRSQETGTIVASGPDAELKVATQVIFKRYAAEEIDLDGDTYFLVDESEVSGIVED